MADNFDTLTVEETPDKLPDVMADTFEIEESPAADFVMEAPQATTIDETSDFVIEEDAQMLPGSNTIVEQKAEDAPKETDWENDGDHSKFKSYFESKFHNVPRHSGQTIPGCERACSYCKDLLRELSKAMRSDLGGKIEEGWADQVYKKLNDHVEQLENAIDKLRANTSTKNKVFASPQVNLLVEGKCDRCDGDVPTWHDVENDRVVCLKCNAVVGSEGLEKVANTPHLNVYISPFERAIVGMLINGACAGGKNIEELWDKMDKKYKFSDREHLSIRQILADYGYPLILDRAKINENDGENDGEMSASYQA